MRILNCTLCGNCFVCPYLERYGYPKEIYLKKDPSVFICTNCGLCNIVCPFNVEPAEAIFSVKTGLIKEKRLTSDNLKAIEDARKFVRKMSGFPLSHVDSTEIVFFPGCALVSYGKRMVSDLKKVIEKKLNCKVGVAIHCCGDPLFQNGDIDSLNVFIGKLRDKLENKGLSKIIFGCANCKKIFKRYLEGFEILHLSQLIEEKDLKFVKEQVVLHQPCPNFSDTEIKESVNGVFGKVSQKIIEDPLCCGLGGSANRLDKEISQNFLNKITKISENKTILTSCFGCKNRFLKNNKKSYHIYEYLLGYNIEKPLTEAKKWLNRISVSLSCKINPLKVILFIILLLGIYLVYNMKREGGISLAEILSVIRSKNYLSALIYLFIYSIGPAFFFPSLLLTVVAGIIWGPFWGVVISITGATIGCAVPFLLSRYLFYNPVKKIFGIRRWEKLSELVSERGWKIVAFTRIVPIFPFPVLNYLFGITPISFFHYLIASFLFMLPACIAYVYFGNSLFDLIAKGEILNFLLSILIISLIMFIPYILRKKINRKTF